MAEAAGLHQDSRKQREVVGCMDDGACRQRVQPQPHHAQYERNKPDEQHRCPGMRNLLGMQQGKRQTCKNNGSRDADEAVCSGRKIALVPEPSKCVEKARRRKPRKNISSNNGAPVTPKTNIIHAPRGECIISAMMGGFFGIGSLLPRKPMPMPQPSPNEVRRPNACTAAVPCQWTP